MVASYPNRKCTCGYSRFRERRTPSSESVQRWMFYDDTQAGGFGSTPLGTLLGGSGNGTWGLFNATNIGAAVDTVCESCSRIRNTTQFGGVTPLSSYITNGVFCVVAADTQNSASCYAVRFDGPDQSYLKQLAVVQAVIPPAPAPHAPLQTAETPPPGAAVADKLLCTALPEVALTAEYTATIVDRCSGQELALSVVFLEAPPMILSPLEADLNGAPRAWLYGGNIANPASQPGSGSRVSIPLDRCSGVVEYDARKGTLPSAQGWTHQGTGAAGDYQLVKGGILRAGTTNGLGSWWQKTLALGANPGRMYSYAVLKDDNTPIGGGNPADGLDFESRYATAVAAPYQGVRYSYADQTLSTTQLDGLGAAAVEIDLPLQWLEIAGGDGSTEAVWAHNSTRFSAAFGGDGSAAALEMIARFGDRNANGGLTGYIRNFVSSASGRFVRAAWTAYTQVTAPILRLYLVADDNASVNKTTRLLIRYTTGTSDPYAEPGLTAEVTVNFVNTNTVFEVPVQLSGLNANAPFWFSVERKWDSGDDELDATVHLIQATVRAI